MHAIKSIPKTDTTCQARHGTLGKSKAKKLRRSEDLLIKEWLMEKVG
jgi:hypothetical protein